MSENCFIETDDEVQTLGGLCVLIDGHWLIDGPPSGKNVLEGIIRAWTEAFPQDELTIRLPAGPLPHFVENLSIQRSGPLSGKNHALSVLTTKAHEDHFDAYLSQNFGGILGSTPKFTFLHDGIYKAQPQWFSMLERLYLCLIKPSLFRSRAIFTSSASEKKRIETLWPSLDGKVEAIGLAVPYALVEATASEPNALPMFSRPYLMTVGRLNIRKNLARLIEAYSNSPISDEFDLYVIGEPNGLAGKIARQHPGVNFLTAVKDDQLRWLYEHATAFIFPSLDEGFGLPIIEAAYFGIPIAASDIAPFREVGVASQYFNPENIESIKLAMERLVDKSPEGGVPYDASKLRSWTAVVSHLRNRILTELKESS
ncbi:glycosyltransferase family 4 protein [Arthrobacter liuii]|uniref:glycosyltransferase family 4 protein n=1 Tax=Arthrobacter liuii TaxID=1476996 RepID=UPI0016639C66|nr:glycosyltransferase family 1 protein [Arthrobacter liuii]